jgi:outer membrane protein
MRRQLDQARLGIKQLEYQEEYTRQNLEAQAANALNAMKTAAAKVKAAENNVALAQKGYRIAQTRYNTGQATLVETQRCRQCPHAGTPQPHSGKVRLPERSYRL